MPTSTRTLALRAIKTALDGVVGATTIERNRKAPLRKADLPALIIYRGGEDVREGLTLQDEFTLSVNVQISVSDAGDEATEEALDDMLAKVLAIIGAEANLTLGGVAQRIDYAGLTDPVENDTEGTAPALQADAIFQVLMATREADPYTAA